MGWKTRNISPLMSFSSFFLMIVIIRHEQALAIMDNFAVTQHTDATELQAVYDVMVATGNGWAAKIHDVCKGRWHGIECVADKNDVLHVVSLSFGVLSDDTAFPVCSQDARISPSVANLTHLKRLFFYKCCKANPKPIPPEIGRLGSSLESLVLRDNGHVGSIPRELSNLSNLHVMDLHNNNLSSAIPAASLSNLSRLQLLDLSDNVLKGQIPSSLGLLSSLRILDLSNNTLHGAIPEALGNCISLKKLDLSNNRLTGPIPPSLGQLRGIALIDFSHNVLTGGIPHSFGGLQELEALVIRGSNMQARIPSSLGNLTKLQALVLSNSGLVGSIPSTLGMVAKLRVLYLDRNKLNGSIPSQIGHLPELSEFNVESNHLSGRIPFSSKLLLRLGQRLHLNNNSGLCYSASIETEAAYLLPDAIVKCKLEITTRSNFYPMVQLPQLITSNSPTSKATTWPFSIKSDAVLRLMITILVYGCLIYVEFVVSL